MLEPVILPVVLEVKTVSGIPKFPYEGWIRQLHFQMGLLEESKTSAKEVRGAILALDLDRGDTKYFNKGHQKCRLFQRGDGYTTI